MLLRKASLAKMRALTSLECSTSCSCNGAQSSSILFALASFTSSSSCCFCSTNHHRRVLKFLPENVTFRKGMFTAPSSVRFAAKASSSAGNNNCDESSKREVQFDYSENTDPVVNENFIAPNFGYATYKVRLFAYSGGRGNVYAAAYFYSPLFSSFFYATISKQLVRYTQHGRTVSGFRNHHNLRATCRLHHHRLEVTSRVRGVGLPRVNVILIGQDGLRIHLI